MNIRRFSGLVFLTALLILSAAAPARAQFETDRSYIGAHIGLGSYESALSYGIDYEYALTKPGEAGPGRIGVGGTLDYWSWTGNGGNGYTWTYSWLPVGAFSAYHFVLDNRRWDLFAGLGLGYIVVNATWRRPDSRIAEETTPYYASNVYWTAIAGARYFVSPAFALHGRLGWGASVLSVGLNLRL